MLHGYILTCNNCKYEFDFQLGRGFMFVRKTMEMIGKMKSGAYGDKAEKFFRENSDGTVDCNYVLLKCDKCGALRNDMDLSLYKRKENTDDPKYPLPNPDFYIKDEDFDHKCGICGSTMRIVDTADGFYEKIRKGEICCPECKAEMSLKSFYKWD